MARPHSFSGGLFSSGNDVAFNSSRYQLITAASGTVDPPEGAVAMRLVAIGAGGNGKVNDPYTSWIGGSGGGGGAAASKIYPVASIDYVVAQNSSSPLTSAVFSVNGVNKTLMATTGETATHAIVPEQLSIIARGGQGLQGDYLFKGGDGIRHHHNASKASGGGAAGPNGNGANGTFFTPSIDASGKNGNFANTGWGWGGNGSRKIDTRDVFQSTTASDGFIGSVMGSINYGEGASLYGVNNAFPTMVARAGMPGAIVIEWFLKE